MIYAAISGGQVLLELGRGFLSNFLAVRATRFLHATMLGRLLRYAKGLTHAWGSGLALGCTFMCHFQGSGRPHCRLADAQ